MMSRMIRYTMISVFGLALAGNGAFAQETPEEGGAEGGGAEGGAEEGGGTPEGGEATPAETGGGEEAMAEGDAGGKPPFILPKGKLAVAAAIGVNLSKEAVAKPIALAPDVWYGVMPKLEVGVAHSNMALSGFWFQGFGGGVCLGGTERGCAKLYNGPIGVLAHFSLMEGTLDLAADGGLVIDVLDPMTLSIKAGVRGRWMSGKIMVMFAPNISIGATKRDEGNKEAIFVPVTVGYMVSPKLHAGVQTGIYGPLDGFGDAYGIPVGVGAMFMVNDKLGVGGSFNFINLAGKGSSADFRDLTVFAMWHN